VNEVGLPSVKPVPAISARIVVPEASGLLFTSPKEKLNDWLAPAGTCSGLAGAPMNGVLPDMMISVEALMPAVAAEASQRPEGGRAH
jgi:hypothetical protein